MIVDMQAVCHCRRNSFTWFNLKSYILTALLPIYSKRTKRMKVGNDVSSVVLRRVNYVVELGLESETLSLDGFDIEEQKGSGSKML